MLESWFKRSWSLTTSVIAALLLVPLDVMLGSLVQKIYRFLHIAAPNNDFPVYLNYVLPFPNIRYTMPNWPFLMLRDVSMEEVLFRLLPVYIAQRLGLPFMPLILLGLADSVFFGWYHGGWYYVGLQGVSGLLYFLLFLKAGAANKRYLWAFAIVLATHYLSDLYLETKLINEGFQPFGEL